DAENAHVAPRPQRGIGGGGQLHLDLILPFADGRLGDGDVRRQIAELERYRTVVATLARRPQGQLRRLPRGPCARGPRDRQLGRQRAGQRRRQHDRRVFVPLMLRPADDAERERAQRRLLLQLEVDRRLGLALGDLLRRGRDIRRQVVNG